MGYRIHWRISRACGVLPGRYGQEATAERAARCWKQELAALDDCPRCARGQYQWEVVYEDDEDWRNTDPSTGEAGHD